MSVLNLSAVLSSRALWATGPSGVPAPDVAIDIRDLRMRYGRTDVLHGISFTARRGEVLAVLGPNGAGKTTTIEMLEGFRMRSAGQVSVLGVDPAHGGEAWRARLGVVLQSWRDHAKWQVRESWRHLATFGVLAGWTAVGLMLAPVVLRRMARRESGSTVAARRERVLLRAR